MITHKNEIKTLCDLFNYSSLEYAQDPALSMRVGYRTRSLTYKQTHDLAMHVAAFLQMRGVQKGDAVLILATNSPHWGSVLWGTLMTGAVIVPLNAQSTREQVEKIAHETGAQILFAHRRFREEMDDITIQKIEYLMEDMLEADCRSFVPVAITPSDRAQIMYTSGTTGDPKGVVLTHENIMTSVQALSTGVSISQSDRLLSILPLSHIFEQVSGFFLPYMNGAHIIYAHSPAAIGALMQKHQITVIAGVPEFLQLVMNKIEVAAEKKMGEKTWQSLLRFVGTLPFPVVRRLAMQPILRAFGGHLRLVASGGAPLDPILEKKWNALGVTLLQGYGMTETAAVISFNTFDMHKPSSVGRPPKNITVRIADDKEVLVKGKNIFSGYFKKEEKTQEVFTDDKWFRTGDMGMIDKEGFLSLKGRKKYMILGPGGQNIYPEDIEQKILIHEEIKDCCVVGYMKASGHVEIHVVIIPVTGEDHGAIDLDHVVTDVNKQMASYQQIGGWSLWPQIDFPRSASRKVKKGEVEKWLHAHKEGRDDHTKGIADKSQLIILLADISGVDIVRITAETKLVSTLNLDSLLRIELVARIEEEYGVMVNEAEVLPETTVADVEEMIKKGPVAEKKATFHAWPLAWWSQMERANYREMTIFPFMNMVMDLHVHGLENLENVEYPVVFMPSHISHYDSAVVAMALPREQRQKISFAAAEDIIYEDYKMIAPLAELMFNSFPFPRKEGSRVRAGLEYMGEVLDHDWSVVLYPEGQISGTEEMNPLKSGAGLIAVEMGVAIVPIRIKGLSKIFPNKCFRPHSRSDVHVYFGKPLTFSARADYKDAQKKIDDALHAL